MRTTKTKQKQINMKQNETKPTTKTKQKQMNMKQNETKPMLS